MNDLARDNVFNWGADAPLLRKALELACDAIYELEIEANKLDRKRSKDPRRRSVAEYWVKQASEQQ